MRDNVRKYLLATVMLLGVPLLYAQGSSENIIRNRLASYFYNYSSPIYESSRPALHSKIDSMSIDANQRKLVLHVNKTFAEQPFTRDIIQRVYRNISTNLPTPFNAYHLSITANGTPIEELCSEMSMHTWGNIDYKGNAWVTPLSLPYKITHGLQGRHLSMWASHGRFYKNDRSMWEWQRPRLFGTLEDLFTQTFMVPLLIPMLEDAGAVVFTPRERDWQKNEVVVDNDTPAKNGSYLEENGKFEWENAGIGFAQLRDFYFDKENPFVDGSARMAETQTSKRLSSNIKWIPNIEEEGRYAVYVSYASMPTSVSDAQYIVKHKGISTRFRVNQQMGGGTWVYLGTFDFGVGQSDDNCVTLNNVSNYRGVVTADAVRFGGGMGNVVRGDSIAAPTRSMLPRYLEGARYNAQWSGMPYSIYGTKESLNDYGEDINARSLMSNYIARGSVFVPFDTTRTEGLKVPIEMSLALHSDAGWRSDNGIVGTLGIYTTGYNDGRLASGLERLASRELCDAIMSQIANDIKYIYPSWTRREMRDENYSETREPQVPSMILEMFSHQNWADMRLGHDPTFKFHFARAIYKGILKYVNRMHGIENTVTQPLPVNSFSAIVSAVGDSVSLSWQPTPDPIDSTAMPLSYVVYESRGDMGYDNGIQVYGNSVKLPITCGQLYRYKVAAVNEGGKSMDSEELCAYSSGASAKHQVLVVNGFQRLAGPLPVDNDSVRGFDFQADPGVSYINTPGYCGKQLYWSKSGTGKEGPTGLGYSGNEYEGLLIAGNTFNYPTLHASDMIASMSDIIISSASRGAMERGDVRQFQWDLVDVILGAQRYDGYSMSSVPALNNTICDALHSCAINGSALLLSGAYAGSDCSQERVSRFLHDDIHCSVAGQVAVVDSTACFQGLNMSFSVHAEPNEKIYSVPSIGVFAQTEHSFPFCVHMPSGYGTAIASNVSSSRSMIMGFPIECVREPKARRNIMQAALTFLLQ